jgi:hypothetical protein
MKKLIFTLFSLFLFLSSRAQVVYHFEQGLGVGPCHQYGREALYTDQLAYQLYKGTLASPQDGTALLKNSKGEDIKWRKVQADSTHRFRGDSFSNGYVYLTYESKKEQTAILTLTGHDMVYVNGVPRGGDQYRYGWMHLPVVLKKGKNEFYARVARFGRFGGITANLAFPEKPVSLNSEDLTISDIVPGLKNDSLWAGVVVQNASQKKLTGAKIYSEVTGRRYETVLPDIPAMSVRKVPVLINGSGAGEGSSEVSADFDLLLSLTINGKETDRKILPIKKVKEGAQYSRTFVSGLD